VFPFQVGGIRWGYVSIVAVIAAFVTVVGIRRWRQLSLKKVQADGQDLR
jgi:hypothetical protein